MFNNFIIALAMMLILEGVLPALFPNKWHRLVSHLLQQPISTIRLMGLISILIGGVIGSFSNIW